MKIEDLKVGRVYRAKRPRGVHRLDGSYVNDRQILYISPSGKNIGGVQNEKIYVNIQPKPREIDRIHQQILYAPRLANHQHSKR